MKIVTNGGLATAMTVANQWVLPFTMPDPMKGDVDVLCANNSSSGCKVKIAVLPAGVSEVETRFIVEPNYGIEGDGHLGHLGLKVGGGETVAIWSDKSTVSIRVQGDLK